MMKLFAVALGSVLIAGTVVTSVACGTAANEDQKQLAIEASCDDFQKPGQQHLARESEIAVDQSLELTLCSNPTTGFQWEPATISDQTVVEQVSHKFAPAEAATPPVAGAPGKDVWVFKGLKKGQSAISLKYSRPWEGGEKGTWTFTLTVVVK